MSDTDHRANDLTAAIGDALRVLVGSTPDTLFEVIGVTSATYDALPATERAMFWTVDRTLQLHRYFRRQADDCDAVARIIRRAADAVLEEAVARASHAPSAPPPPAIVLSSRPDQVH